VVESATTKFFNLKLTGNSGERYVNVYTQDVTRTVGRDVARILGLEGGANFG